MREATIFMANGSEECEALLILDLLRRAQIEVELVSIERDLTVISSHGVKITCDSTFSNYKPGPDQILILPGGMPGTDRLAENTQLLELLRRQIAAQRPVGAICAAPTVLEKAGLLTGKQVTCYPGVADQLQSQTHYTPLAVQEDGLIITGQALGAAIPFALHIIRRLRDQDLAEKIARQICFDPVNFVN